MTSRTDADTTFRSAATEPSIPSRRVAWRALVGLGVLFAAAALVRPTAEANAWTRVTLNGRPVAVSFNDGDSFRIQGGQYQGVQSRLVGFNSLESFGPGHQWGDWHPYELYTIAKLATLLGRRGTWHCFTDGGRDTYGRLTVECPDLIVASVSAGYAHIYNPGDTPSRPEYIAAQVDAIRHRRGMWAHGVPLYVMTSVHSFDEDPQRDFHYDRLISTIDGHSESRQHRNTYRECQWVCNEELAPPVAETERAALTLRNEPTLSAQLAAYGSVHLREFITRFVRIGTLPEYVDPALGGPLLAHLEQLRARNALPTASPQRGSCMLYVAFERRYGQRRASCLADHGTVPDDMRDHFAHH